ncbi:hypothetical protein [Pseudoalteromonas luteoviolacea]|uniref:Uncharacterized protein n=1 Tax=Pseudoalteromonas luteoviolacea H33 TaxID=1365251 RepID=A0A162AGM7_9GAMM|nr:hypothetical protein [Pseudoalteromonas luteoviolacea]KZN49402.1 hypothetical protein N476_19130 [Pseudoalteromonas luteoviolacea H33]KZN72665.1 hypothetical protein N477_25050 [Pseudoalteromonas luteoviolacea H33-S]
MKIDSVYAPYTPTRHTVKTKAQHGNSLPQNTTQPPSSAKAIDMNNTGMNELNALIQATGDDRLLFRLPHDTFRLVDGELQGSSSSNFLAQIENEIAFEQSRGSDTGELESFLAVLKEYQGYPLQSHVAVTA